MESSNCTQKIVVNSFPFSHDPPCAGALLVTTVTRRCRGAAARSVSVPCGGRCLDRVTLSQANAAAGSGRRGGRVTSAWRGMCVDQLGSSVRLTHSFSIPSVVGAPSALFIFVLFSPFFVFLHFLQSSSRLFLVEKIFSS